MELVTKYNGKKAPRENCRKIKGDYYEINVDCFRVDGKWNRVDNGLIVKDYENNTWHNAKRINENSTHLYGIVEVKNGVPQLGYFSPSNKNVNIVGHPILDGSENNVNLSIETKNGYVKCERTDNAKFKGSLSSQTIACIDSSIPESLGYKKGLSSPNYYPNLSKYNKHFKKSLGPGYGRLNYNSDGGIPEAIAKFERLYSPSLPLNRFRNFASLLGNTSFGLEFETCNGFIDKKRLDEIGLIPLRDGSLRRENGNEPYEFVTIPLSGIKGVAALHDSVNELNNCCESDITCSLHIHLGNVPTTRMFVVALMRLSFMLQDDLFSMFPYYKTNSKGIKSKDYCKKFSNSEFKISKLPSKFDKNDLDDYINYNFNQIFKFAACGHDVGREFNVVSASHPINQAKWHITSRYYWLNVVPLLFKTSRTIEFRLHTPTLNRAKVFNWLLIVNAIVKYATKYQTEIFNRNYNKPYTVEEIINSVYSDTQNGELAARHLVQYVRSRKNEFKVATENGDLVGQADMDNDLDYSFTSSTGITNIELDL